MTYETPSRAPLTKETSGKPVITSYDTGDEHSLEHYAYVQRLLEEAEEEAPTLAMAASAS